ncbi:MAG: hypothetical protein JRE73_06390 [Deltaproteobacteria bacterium]|nr:hypothetical protein [Deltaproteobacteria bacterium]
MVDAVVLADKRIADLSSRAAMLRDAAHARYTGFRVLSVPMVPESAQRSAAHTALLVMLPIVTVVIFALVFIVRRLRSLTAEAPREVAWWGNGPVLGTTVWPRDPNALESFVDELEDHGVYGAGRTLVVPATEAEREIACSFAMRLAEAPWLAAAILAMGRAAEAAFVTGEPIGCVRACDHNGGPTVCVRDAASCFRCEDALVFQTAAQQDDDRVAGSGGLWRAADFDSAAPDGEGLCAGVGVADPGIGRARAVQAQARRQSDCSHGRARHQERCSLARVRGSRLRSRGRRVSADPAGARRDR